MSTAKEIETVIVISEADRLNGYFRFGTNKPAHFRKLCNKCGGEKNLIEVNLSNDAYGNITWWQCKVPIQNLQSTLGLKTHRSTPKKPRTPEQIAAFERLKAARRPKP